MRYCKTGASIDGKYYCQTCYDEKIDEIENSILYDYLGN